MFLGLTGKNRIWSEKRSEKYVKFVCPIVCKNALKHKFMNYNYFFSSFFAEGEAQKSTPGTSGKKKKKQLVLFSTSMARGSGK